MRKENRSIKVSNAKSTHMSSERVGGLIKASCFDSVRHL